MAHCFLFLWNDEETNEIEEQIDINYDLLPDDQHPDYDPSFWEGENNE